MTPAALALALIFAFVGDPLQDLADAGRWDDLIVAAQTRLEAAPDDPGARYWLGRAWLARGEGLLGAGGSEFARDLADASLGRAVDALADVPPGEGVTSDAREWWGYARLLRGDEDLGADAEAWFEESGSAYAAFLRGQLARSTDPAEAVEWFRRAASARPDRADFQIALCDALAVRGDVEDALSAWEAARRAGAEREVLLRSLLGILPGERNAGGRLARIDELVEDDPEARRDGWLAWYRAYSLEQAGRLEDAEAALAAADTDRGAQVDRFHAHLLVRLERYDDALARLSPWIAAFDPDATTEALDIADALALGQRWDAALAAYELVLESQASDERAARNRALTLSRAGREAEAVQTWEALEARYGKRADVLNDAALMLEGMGRDEQAAPLFERAAALDPTGPATENLAAYLLEREPARALALLERVVATDPTRDRALYLRKQARDIRFR